MSEIATNEYYRLYKIHPQGAATKEIEVYRRINAIEIPKGATNGDAIKALFDVKEVDTSNTYCVYFPEEDEDYGHYFFKEWWDATYKGEKKDE